MQLGPQEEFNARLEAEADFSFRTVPLAATSLSLAAALLGRANFRGLVLGCIEAKLCK